MFMKKILIILLILGILPSSIANANNQSYGLEIGDIAPNFTLRDTLGNPVTLTDYIGKKVMINFWATWCPPCKKEIPELQKFSEEMGDKLVILAINIDGNGDKQVQAIITKMNITFPVLLDENDKINELYQVITIPTTYFIDEQGKITNKYFSAMPIERMREFVK